MSFCKQLTAGILLTAFLILVGPAPTHARLTASHALAQAGIESGLAVYVGTDPVMACGLHNNGKILVHVLAPEDAAGDIRLAIVNAGVHGLVSVETPPSWKQLPYPDNFVNALIVDDMVRFEAMGLTSTELSRIVAPFGSLQIITRNGLAKTSLLTNAEHELSSSGFESIHAGTYGNEQRVLAKKALAAGMDEWTHRMHGPDNNSFSRDQLIKPPTHLKWSSGGGEMIATAPTGAFCGYRIANGRAAYIHYDKTVKGNKPILFVRDANNGTFLWKNSADFIATDPWLPMLLIGDRIYVVGSKTGPIMCFNAANGQKLMSYTNVKFEATGASVHLIYCDDKLIVAAGPNLTAVDPVSGNITWQKNAADYGATYFHFPCANKDEGLVWAVASNELVGGPNMRWPRIKLNTGIMAFDIATGKELWRNTQLKNNSLSQIVYYNGMIGLFGHGWPVDPKSTNPAYNYRAITAVLDPKTGNIRWIDEYTKRYTSKLYDYYYMFMRDGYMYKARSHHMEIQDLRDGSYRILAPQSGDKSNNRCGRGAITPNYIYFGYGTWIDKEYNYLFKPVRRSVCATMPMFAYGMQYYTPTNCRCYTQLEDGKNYLALCNDGTRKVVSEEWRLTVPEKSWPASSGGSPGTGSATGFVPVSVLRKALDGPDMQLSSPIVQDWPENRISSPLRKQRASTRSSVGQGYDIVSHGSRLLIEIDKDGQPIDLFATAGRVTLPAVRSGNMACVGGNDGYVYGYDLANRKLAWKFLAAPYDRRVMRASQLESTFPITSIIAENDQITVTAGENLEFTGGAVKFTLDPASGNVLGKKQLVPVDASRPINPNGTIGNFDADQDNGEKQSQPPQASQMVRGVLSESYNLQGAKVKNDRDGSGLQNASRNAASGVIITKKKENVKAMLETSTR